MVAAFSMFPDENELLLPRNSKFLIKGVEKVDDNIILKMDLLEQENAMRLRDKWEDVIQFEEVKY